MNSSIVTWALAFMVTHSPIAKHTDETADEVQARYESIAKDLTSVVFDPQEAPVYSGPKGRIQTVALMESIALFESGFRKDVDQGVGPKSRGDHGRSVCLMQIQVGEGKTPDYNIVKGRIALPSDPANEVISGYTSQELLADRSKCFRTALHFIRQSFTACSSLPVANRLAVYASGSCDRGYDQSQQRILTGQKWFYGHVPSFTDDNAFQPDPLVQE